MALSASGIGSGLDIAGLVNQLMEAERQPLVRLAARQATFQAQLSAYGQYQSTLASLQDAATASQDASRFTATRASVASGGGFTATSSPGAPTGTYAIEVEQLARAQLVSFAPTKDGDGEYNLRIGGEGGTEFLHQATVGDLAKSINDAALGVQATVVNQGASEWLVLRGSEAGQAFTVEDWQTEAWSVIEADEEAALAELFVDGILVERASNRISDVISGVTLNLTATTDTAFNLTISSNPASATSAVTSFVDAYNAVVSRYKSLTTYDTANNTASTLTNDGALRNVQSQLRNLLNTRIAGIDWEWPEGMRPEDQTTGLFHMGISFQRDGTLKFDSARFTEALNNPGMDVAGFFTGTAASGETPAVTGFATVVSNRLDSYLQTGGVLDARKSGIQSSIDNIERRTESLNRRLELVQARYDKQFMALDMLIANMTQTSDFLMQQIAVLPGASGGQR